MNGHGKTEQQRGKHVGESDLLEKTNSLRKSNAFCIIVESCDLHGCETQIALIYA